MTTNRSAIVKMLRDVATGTPFVLSGSPGVYGIVREQCRAHEQTTVRLSAPHPPYYEDVEWADITRVKLGRAVA